MKILYCTDQNLHFTPTDLRLILGSGLPKILWLVGGGAGIYTLILVLKPSLCTMRQLSKTGF